MRAAIIITLLGAGIGTAALIYAFIALDFTEHRETSTAPVLTVAEKRAALLGPITPVSFDTVQNGQSVRSGPAGGAVFELTGGREVAVGVPGGWELTGEFVLLNELSGGFFLARSGADADEAPLYFNFVDARRRIEPGSTEDAERLYQSAADQILATGALPYLDGELPVTRADANATGLYLCLRRPDGLEIQGGTRFIGPLSVTSMRVGGCPEDLGAIGDDLWLAETALGANR